MPSPLAHASLALLAIPALDRERTPVRALLARPVLALLIAFFLCLPDIDILINRLVAGDAFDAHGTVTHALVWALPAGLLFAALARPLCGARWVRLIAIGAALYASHALLDCLTRGRGVALFWPFSTARVEPPVALFVGVRHSDLSDWRAHALTLATESVFAMMVWCAAIAVCRSRKHAPSEPPP